jgi:hypothetical protein
MVALNQKFESLTITLDGQTFHGCTFTRCRLRFNGQALPDLGGNTFSDCEWDFVGHAGDTLAFLQTLYHDHGGIGLVETVFNRLRDRQPLTALPHA